MVEACMRKGFAKNCCKCPVDNWSSVMEFEDFIKGNSSGVVSGGPRF